MGLENLKSIFNEGAGTNNSQISGRLSDGGEISPFANHPDEFSKLDFDTNVPTPVDFLTSPVQVPGFTIRMDSKDKSQFSPDGVNYIQPTKMIEEFGEIGSAVNFMNEAQNNPTSISGFDINFDNKGEGNGNSKYIGQISKFNNNQVVGTIPFVQPALVEPLAGIKRNIGLQIIGENSNIFDSDGNFKFIEQKISYGPLSISNPNDKSIQFETLYNTNQTTKSIKKKNDRLNIRFKSSQVPTNRGSEPYVISEIGDNVAGRDFPLERSVLDAERISKFLISRKGVEFIAKQNLLGLNSKVITSGLSITGKLEKKAGNQRFQTSYNPLSTLGSLARVLGGQVPNVGLGFLLNREDPFPLDPTRILTPRNYIEHLIAREVGTGTATSVASLFGVNLDNIEFPAPRQEDEFYNPGSFLEQSVKKLQNAAFGNNVKDLPKIGDKLTLSNMIQGDTLESLPSTNTRAKNNISTDSVLSSGLGTILDIVGNQAETNIESEKGGLPFYFKDLRDDTYVIFRGYLSGITENVSPSWAAENYIGRSEPVYIYERAERDINFTLKLFATTKDELPMIYKKMNRLTSMCYPEYKEDVNFSGTSETVESPEQIVGGLLNKAKSKVSSTLNIPNTNSIRLGKMRMKPPLVKFRMGDMYGSQNNEMTGWIKSVSYNVPDNSVWETQRGRKVPKHIEANIGFQVIHGSPPELNTKFYGFGA